MRDRPLPSELAAVWGHNADLAYRGNDEWSSACPRCNPAGRGGNDPSDRFRMFNRDGPPRGWCRSCDIKLFANADPRRKYSDGEIEQARASHYKWLQEENKRLRSKIRWLKEQDFWRRWHEDMGEEAREIWHKAGISDTLIEVHKLGYTIDRYAANGGALSIPYIHYVDGSLDLQTIQFRLLVPPDKGDKYRFFKGTKANWFYPWPHDTIKDVVLVTEGAKKSMVLWQTIANLSKFTYRGVDITVVASPSKYVPGSMLEELGQAELVIWMLDPDAYDRPQPGKETVIERNASIVGEEKCRHVKTMGKIDDMILNSSYGIDGHWIQSVVEQAEPVIPYNPNRRPTTRYL